MYMVSYTHIIIFAVCSGRLKIRIRILPVRSAEKTCSEHLHFTRYKIRRSADPYFTGSRLNALVGIQWHSVYVHVVGYTVDSPYVHAVVYIASVFYQGPA